MTILLHGFWGQPRDWNTVLQRLPLGETVLTPDLYDVVGLAPVHTLEKWTENFWRWVDEHCGQEPLQLVGYSMGARLAVTAVMKHPERVKRALFLSGNPLLEESEHASREIMEQEWTKKFLTLEWAELESAWQEQAIFGSSPSIERRKSPEMRELLGLSLTRWSPRLHPFTAEDVKSLSNRMEWAFGALDQKYCDIAKSLQELPVQGQITLVAGCGHRLAIEAADFVCDWIVRKN